MIRIESDYPSATGTEKWVRDRFVQGPTEEPVFDAVYPLPTADRREPRRIPGWLFRLLRR